LALVSRAALRAAAFSCLLVPFIQYGGTHREFKLIHAESIRRGFALMSAPSFKMNAWPAAMAASRLPA
ncbi:hypothetical protein, partial [Ralstonia pseudosolanacearum]|uniref:hypothetical protein n=1 Tax=Ralstonia pseudosolanacearum TaxID=1310165 RepID=UPI001E5C7CB7